MLRILAMLLGSTVLAAPAAAADRSASPSSTPDEIIVTATASKAALDHVATTKESVTDAQAADTVNRVGVEDMLRYVPNVLIRQRHFGDAQDPITTRTSGVGSSARSLIYADGVLLSALIGNNNGVASPHWGLVSPDAVARIDVLYGPFAAAYPGNSIGAVVEITTKAPTAFEATLEAQGAGQVFAKYGDRATYGTGRIAASVGARFGRFSIRAAYSHLDSDGQPLSYATAVVPVTTSAAGTPVVGGYRDASRTGVAVTVLGSTAIPHQVQDSLTTRLTVDLTPTLIAAYTAGLFRNDERATANSYLHDTSGTPVYAGAVSLGGRAYTLANTVFSSGVYDQEDIQLAQGLSLTSLTGGMFDYELIATRFDTLKSRQRFPSGGLPGGFAGGPGSVISLDDTGWWTLDAKGTWRPSGAGGTHLVTFGAHADAFRLNNPRYALSDWIAGSPGVTTGLSRGRTEQQALWVQDVWRLAPSLTATIGGRYEHWAADDGVNFNATPALDVRQPTSEAWKFSPKAVLRWDMAPGWTFKGSVGVAYRFPTVQELYQQVTLGPVLASPDPHLRPEHAVSTELSAQRDWNNGRVRLSLFSEDLDDALISQAGTIGNSTVPVNFVQNVDHVRNRGVEVVFSQNDVFFEGVQLSGWLTYVESAITRDRAFPKAVGKAVPQLPPLRAAVVATWKPDAKFAMTLAARYSERSFGTIDNSDGYTNTYQGFGAFFVVDAHLRYQFSRHVVGELGVDNLGDRSYFLFHPFPQRTVIGSVKLTY